MNSLSAKVEHKTETDANVKNAQNIFDLKCIFLNHANIFN